MSERTSNTYACLNKTLIRMQRTIQIKYVCLKHKNSTAFIFKSTEHIHTYLAKYFSEPIHTYIRIRTLKAITIMVYIVSCSFSN